MNRFVIPFVLGAVFLVIAHYLLHAGSANFMIVAALAGFVTVVMKEMALPTSWAVGLVVLGGVGLWFFSTGLTPLGVLAAWILVCAALAKLVSLGIEEVWLSWRAS